MKFLRNILIIGLLLYLGASSFSQTLNNTYGLDQFEKISFNNKQLKTNKVRSIKTEYMTKKELRPISKKPNISAYYEFNNEGQLIMYYRTFLLHDTIYDTLVEFYSYNEANQVKQLIKSEFGRYGIYTYTYNDNGQVTSIGKAQEENISTSKIVFIPSNHQEISKEHFEFSQIDSLSYVRYTLSEDNIRYKEKEVVFEHGRIKKSFERLIFGTQRHKIYEYKYFEDRLVSKDVVSNYSSELVNRFVYRYYSDGNLSSMETFGKDEQHNLFTTEFLYKDSKLLSSILKKEEKSGTIEITKFKYTFY